MVKSNVDLLKGSILKGLIIFAVPIFISNLFQQLYNTVDIMIVGNYLGDMALGAIGASAAIYEMIIGFALGVGNGLSIVTARAYGAKDEDGIKKSVAGALVIGAILTLIVMIISVLFLYPLLELLNTPANIIDEAYSYIFVIGISVGVIFIYNLSASLLRAIGNSIAPLIFLVVSAILNVGLDILLITEFNMGIRGAAVATIIAEVIASGACIIYILKKCPILIPRKEHFKIDRELYKELLGQGLSMGMMMLIVSTGTIILQTAINGFGHLIIAGHTAARKVGSIVMMPVGVLAMSLATFVSQNKGADKSDRIRKGVKYANLMSGAWGLISLVVAVLLGNTILEFVTGSNEKELLNNGVWYLIINSAFYAVLGILLNLRNSLQGIGEKVLPLVSSVIEFAGKILFVIFLIPKLGYFGVMICEPIIWCVMTIQLAYAFYKNSYIKNVKIEKSEELEKVEIS
ncbi:MAG: MATE family efflux transporter [Clostridium sp.]|uniref:MATE family efflux transporter n=1 Tax=Clostridium sp. TaxID=1506 RepID=UPI003F31F039